MVIHTHAEFRNELVKTQGSQCGAGETGKIFTFYFFPDRGKIKSLSQQDIIIIIGQFSIFKIWARSCLSLWSWVNSDHSTSQTNHVIFKISICTEFELEQDLFLRLSHHG